MRRIVFIVTLFIIAFGCNSKKPENLIEKEKFIDILTDIHIADGVLSAKKYQVYQDTEQIETVYKDVLNKYNITQKDFSTTINYYSKNIKKFEKIYEIVSENLLKKEIELQNELKAVKQKE